MIIHPTIHCLMITGDQPASDSALHAYLEPIDHVQLSVRTDLSDNTTPFDVIITDNRTVTDKGGQQLADFVRAGGGWLNLTDGREAPLPEIFGAQPSPVGPQAELRVLFQDAENKMAARLPDAVYVPGRYQSLELTREDTAVILYADWRYEHSPVLTTRKSGSGQVACTTLQACDHPVLQQIFYRLIQLLASKDAARDRLNVGLLGYPPWLGRYHATGVQETAGLHLAAVGEINSERLDAAVAAFPGLTTHRSADDLAADSAVDLVFIATPPNTHCRLSLQMMAAGKHVVCEKPLALDRHETTQMAAKADQFKVHLSCHQNRRWDADYLAIKDALEKGAIGELFYAETFVGGFHHPCGYWHSHEAVSGGLSYDWGGHYLDWIISLMDCAPESVISTRHKRVWHDVTNADQERIQIRFTGNQEAEFIHSDIAAALKPKWYLLGTEGGIVGNWQELKALTTDPIIYFREEPIPITEKAPELILHQRHSGGPVTSRELVLSPRQIFGFHRNLADHLLMGEPLQAPLEDSMTVIAILEAAARSAASGGSLERIDG